jgi:hypothetical protein
MMIAEQEESLSAPQLIGVGLAIFIHHSSFIIHHSSL